MKNCVQCGAYLKEHWLSTKDGSCNACRNPHLVVTSSNSIGKKTRLELLCEAHGQQGGTIHQFNRQYAGIDFLQLTESEFNTAMKIIKANRKDKK